MLVSRGETVVNQDWETLQLHNVFGGLASAEQCAPTVSRKCLKGTNLPHDFIC